MRVFLQALGCRLNEAELETWSRDCRERGFTLSEDAEQADLVIINTCAVTGESVRKSRQLIRRMHRESPQARLVVSGCYASLSPDDMAGELGVDLVVPNPDKDRLISIAADSLNLPVMPEAATEPGENALLGRSRQRAFIKVQDGCRYRCAFCIVTKARGEERSRAIDEVVEEVQADPCRRHPGSGTGRCTPRWLRQRYWQRPQGTGRGRARAHVDSARPARLARTLGTAGRISGRCSTTRA